MIESKSPPLAELPTESPPTDSPQQMPPATPVTRHPTMRLGCGGDEEPGQETHKPFILLDENDPINLAAEAQFRVRMDYLRYMEHLSRHHPEVWLECCELQSHQAQDDDTGSDEPDDDDGALQEPLVLADPDMDETRAELLLLIDAVRESPPVGLLLGWLDDSLARDAAK